MALRLIEMIIPDAEPGEVEAVLKDADTLGLWTDSLSQNLIRVRVLVQAKQTEEVSDLISQRYGARKGFRLILLAVEATAPAVEEPVRQGDAAPELKEKKKTPSRVSREELYSDVAEGAEMSTVFMITVVLSTVVCAIGLIQANVAVVVGAMVIAPLLGPIVALALGTTLGDFRLVTRALKTSGLGITAAFLLSLAIGVIIPVDPFNPEILVRTHVGFSDVILALAAGSAGALAYNTGLPASLVGVMVAVALLPPLVSGGLLAGSGYGNMAVGSIVLVITNVTCINLAGVLTFLVQRVRPRTWWEEKKARKATQRAVFLWVVVLAILLLVILRGWGIQPR
jgi:uncharacterized hydrophobic protein (TIGR00341 family)